MPVNPRIRQFRRPFPVAAMSESSSPAVFLQHTDYQKEHLELAIARFAPHLGLDRSFHGRTVLLKPNLISALASPLACTDTRILLAMARWFLDHGATVLVGDSPAFGSAALVLRRLGVMPELKKLAARVVEFSASQPLDVAGSRLSVARQALECDLLVNLPKIKAHGQMYYTGAVKNFFGLVIGMKKSRLHMTHGKNHHEFSTLLSHLPRLVARQITVADAVDVMHVSGPVRGARLTVGCLAAGLDPFAVDTALIAALELAPERCPLQSLALATNQASSFPENILYPCESPENFYGSGFIAPSALAPVRFHSLRFVVSTAKRLALALRR
ncbi:MAG: DUF362 domain-containing protein [Desulfobulbaceae bacterium]|jgi:uncharacterized protein (DUF362 family)|nr:DUF362 domain-containing protein [Desulfobulbaceae bacterium]